MSNRVFRQARYCAALVACLFSAAVVAQTCPPEGRGKHNDPTQNILKNRQTAPSSFTEMTVAQFKKEFKPNLGTPRRRSAFSQAQLNTVAPTEAMGVSLVGYIERAQKQGPEDTNCGDPKRVDYHIWIGSRARKSRTDGTKMRSQSVVVEITPGWQDHEPTWTIKALDPLAKAGTKVRVSGWVMYDPEHPNMLRKTRGTLWEIHPVTKIEYLDGGAWKGL